MTIAELDSHIKKTFDNTKVLSVDIVYEKTDSPEELKLVIFLNKVLYENINVLYTKLIFIVDSKKINVVKNYFTYLYDINCVYHRINFTDLTDMSNKINDIFKNERFVENIKILSKFTKSPATLINRWFTENGVSDVSVTGVKYEPKVKTMPCESLFFSFVIDLNNNQKISLDIVKEGKDSFLFKFSVLDQFYTADKQTDLGNLVQVIGDMIKNKIKM